MYTFIQCTYTVLIEFELIDLKALTFATALATKISEMSYITRLKNNFYRIRYFILNYEKIIIFCSIKIFLNLQSFTSSRNVPDSQL